jgi:hypothetical protein
MTAPRLFPCLSGGQITIRSFHFIELAMWWARALRNVALLIK